MNPPDRAPCPSIRAVFWDFGGVVLTSPFEAFRAFEARNGLPRDFIRTVNSRDPDDNAWARFERSETDRQTFSLEFARESEALGHRIEGEAVLGLLSGEIREEMVTAIERLKPRFKLACLTNNVNHGAGPGMARDPDRAAAIGKVMALFDAVVESSKVGVRKPEPGFYRIACEMLDVRPQEVVFLDDLGINLKPARAMGMHTIKVLEPGQALDELEGVLGVELR